MTKVTYKEPKSYFNADMKKAMKEYEKQQKQAKQEKQTTSKKPAKGKQ